jgi:uncharacterized membrane protein YfcA
MKMSTSVLLLLIVIGIITGFVAGMLGIGGAIIMIPALVLFLGLGQQAHRYYCSVQLLQSRAGQH